MANRKVSELSALTSAASAVDDDYIPVVDVSEAQAADRNKRMTLTELAKAVVQESEAFSQSGIAAPNTANRTVQTKVREILSVTDAKNDDGNNVAGDGVQDDTTGIQAALASLSSGGQLHFPRGRYLHRRGDGTLLADTIAAGNLTISGVGAASVLVCQNAAGAVPNNAGNQLYNVFQATGKDNIAIENLAVEGYGCLGYFDDCENVTARNITVDGLLANAGGYLFDKSLYFYKCTGVRVHDCHIDNGQFPVYFSGDATTRTKDAVVHGNTFTQTVAAGSFTSLFPVGVYVFFGDEIVVTGNTFRDIYSSLDSGTSGTGMGYGVYEGDGECRSLVVTGNTFDYTGKGSKNATAIYVNDAESTLIANNIFRNAAAGRLSWAVRLDTKGAHTGGAHHVVTGNTLISLQTGFSHFGINIGGSAANAATYNINGNTIQGFFNCIRVDSALAGGAKLSIVGNICKDASGGANIHLEGTATAPLKFPRLHGNTITGGTDQGILFNGYCISPIVIGNTVLDGNTGGGSAETDAAIRFSSFSFGSTIIGNVIGNTPGGGQFAYGISNASSATGRIFKDITANNTFMGIAVLNQQYLRFPTVSPTVSIFDVNYGDFIQNVTLNAGGIPGWQCVRTSLDTITADASNAIGTTVSVASTADYAVGDIILLSKTNNPYNGDYADTTTWHATTVASITNATDFVLTDAIPAGDGTYASGTAVVKRARFRAAAAIAA